LDIAKEPSLGLTVQGTRDWTLVGWTVYHNRIRWEVLSQPLLTALSPALLQQALDVTISPIMRLHPFTIGDAEGYLYTQACAY
jgi:hypothetical protein